MDDKKKDTTDNGDSIDHDTSASPGQAPLQDPLDEHELKNAFKTYILQKQSDADSVYDFAKYLKIEEAEFYNYFSSLKVLEQEIWDGYFEETISRLKSDEVYLTYTVREKLLAFFYTLFELLKEDRSYIIKTERAGVVPRWTPEFLGKFKAKYFQYINELIEEGKESGEVAERFLLSKNYDQGLWLQFLFVLNFWMNDESKGFEKTDAAVEKAINFSVDLMGRSALDSFTDYTKFIFQSWKPS